MNGMRQRSQALANYEGLPSELVQHLQQIQFNTELVKYGIDEIGEVFQYTHFRGVTTLAAAEALKRAAQISDPAQLQAIRNLEQQYLGQLTYLAGQAGNRIILEILNAPASQENQGGFLRGLLGG